MIEAQRSYYAIIPASVRYDNDLPAGVKLFYGEISSLCDENGVCLTSNRYFARLYKVHLKTISTWISLLAYKGYIQVGIYKENRIKITALPFH